VRCRRRLAHLDANLCEFDKELAEANFKGYDLLTELPDVAAAQEAQPSLQAIAELSGRSRLPGRSSDSARLIAAETGHTGPNQSAAFSSLPIFDINCSGPGGLLQRP
jgi:hypothetical protein